MKHSEETNRLQDKTSSKSSVLFLASCFSGMKDTSYKHMQIIRSKPSIALVPLLVLIVLIGSGLSLTFIFAKSEEEVERSYAVGLATETGQWFADQLDLALLPLFSLAQFVTELPDFADLSTAIGPAFGTDSLPFVENKPTHRNVTGLCDDEETVQRFNEIAATIKRNSNMEGVLVNLQIAPDAVVCLVYPLNNTEDFESPVFLDNSGAVGHDLLTDPKRKFIAESTIPSDDVVIAGPLKLSTCGDCDPTVEKAFIARLPIALEGHFIEVDGIEYEKWGFAVAILNWNALISRSEVYDTFEQEGFGFQLTRTDQNYDTEAGTYTEKVVVLAETPNFSTENHKFVSTALQTTNNEWIMTVHYRPDKTPIWKVWALAATVLISFFISCLIYTIIIQNRIHTERVAEQSALLVENAKKATKSERELNDFIAHEVRNPLAAAMSACTFVSTAVNETSPQTYAESQESVRADVGIIDTSLRFINDLLRSMLDIHRAASGQMVLEPSETDMLRDILEPVSSMLYSRDANFDVVIDCPENMLVMTDKLRLQQVVLNLARNSVKFVEEGFVRIRVSLIDGSVCVFVEDSGPGICAEKRKDLFCRFQESLDSLNQGTGIGLNLCKCIVDIMEGELWLDETYKSGVNSNPGTRIVLDLKTAPLTCETPINCNSTTSTISEGEAGGIELEEIENPRELPKDLSVLVVDDERILRKLLCRSIAKLAPDWTLREAASGETALQLILDKNESFDLILMDQYMTSTERALTGTETVRKLRGKGVDSRICGLSANFLADAFVAAGADSFVMKPFPCRHDELKPLLFHLLESKKRPSEQCELQQCVERTDL